MTLKYIFLFTLIHCVFGSLPHVKITPLESDIVAGVKVTLTCRVLSNHDDNVFAAPMWLNARNGKFWRRSYSSSTKFKIEPNNTFQATSRLTFTPTQWDDGFIVKCVSRDNTAFDELRLKVLYSPQCEIVINDNVNSPALGCFPRSNSAHPVAFTWEVTTPGNANIKKIDGKDLKAENNGSFLPLDKNNKSRTKYSCYVKNNIGQGNCTVWMAENLFF